MKIVIKDQFNKKRKIVIKEENCKGGSKTRVLKKGLVNKKQNQKGEILLLHLDMPEKGTKS